MSEDRFFQNIRSAMVEYSPEVPQSVYIGMRKKLWWSNFTRISATRFNIWYTAIIVASTALFIHFNVKDDATVSVNAPAPQTETSDVVSQDPQIPSSQNAEANIQPMEISTESISSKPIRPTVSPIAIEQEKPGDVSSGMAEQVIVSEPVTSNEPPSGEKKDSALTAGKAVKKGLKVKTFQSTDK